MEAHRPDQENTGPSPPPLVSVLMASFRAAPYIGQAIASVLHQSHQRLEIIVVDDGSDDGSPDIVEAIAKRDPRIRLLRSPGRKGPAHARNLGLNAATGEWLAVVDADDLVHPERFERLLAAAYQLNSDIVFDDLMQFYDDGSPVTFLLGEGAAAISRISPVQWIRAGSRPDLPVLGYLKPLIRTNVLKGLRYDENLRVGEDYDLILRLLLTGASAWVLPEPLYFYRKHANSVSHRLFEADYEAMIHSQNDVAGQAGSKSPRVDKAFAQRLRRLRTGLASERVVTAIKRREPLLALGILARHPGMLARLARAAAAVTKRRQRVPGVAPNRSVEASPLRMHLAPEASTYDRPADAEVIVIPPEPPHDLRKAGRHHHIWADIANRSLGRRVELTWDGAAGRYAAGFILGSLGDTTESSVQRALAEVAPP